jgi:hypothetical protein
VTTKPTGNWSNSTPNSRMERPESGSDTMITFRITS